MRLLDKVKETAAKAGEAAKKGAAQVKDKVGDAQLQKKSDDDAKAIGYLIVAEKTEGQAPPAGEIDRLVGEIVEYRSQIAEVPEILQKPEGGAVQESAPAATMEQKATVAEGPPASEPVAGDFKLD